MRVVFFAHLLLVVAARFLVPQKFPTTSSGHRTRPVINKHITHTPVVPRMNSAVQLLWNLTDDIVGKTTSISLNVQANVVITGTTFTPVMQVTSLSLDSGKVVSKASPDKQFIYGTALSKDASISAVYGCPAQEGLQQCSVSVYKGTDFSASPVWGGKVRGYQWWGATGVKMNADGSIVIISALKTFPQEVQPVATDVWWFNPLTGKLIGNFSMEKSLGEVWINENVVATREVLTSTAFVRFLSASNISTNCSVEADYNGLALSSTLNTVVQPFVDSARNLYASQQKGGLQCAAGWQWPLPPAQELLTVGTSDIASVFAAINNLTITIYVFPTSSSLLTDPPKPLSFALELPPGSPVQITADDVQFAFSRDGVHLGISVAGLGIYYVNVQSAPTSALHIYSDNNPCGSLSMAIEPDNAGNVIMVVDFNQVIDISPSELDCMDGGNGLSAFKITV